MSKKKYIKPQMEAVEITMGQQLLAGSPVNSVDGNGGFDLGGGGDGTGTTTPQAPMFGNPEWDVLLDD